VRGGTNMKNIIEIRAVYTPSEDMTFILRETMNTEGDPISTEVVGFYYGEPDDESTNYFIGKLKAEY
jgi:hypothetical protein